MSERNTMTPMDLFHPHDTGPVIIPVSEQASLFPGFLIPEDEAFLADIRRVLEQSPLRHFHTPSGHKMSVRSSNCGRWGWLSDNRGYQYKDIDPLTGKHWPEIPSRILEKVMNVAELAGFSNFQPDSCLINVYKPGAKMGLHQDKDEADFSKPVVSLSFGLPVIFMWGGFKRSDKYQKITLQHADAFIWGGKDRLRYHGVQQLKEAVHPLTGRCRVNLTVRQAN